MTGINVVDHIQFLAFWLIFVRLLTILVQTPLLDVPNIPVVIKVLFTVVLTYAFFPQLKVFVIEDIKYLGVENIWALTTYNVVIGLVVGFVIKAIMSVFSSAGSLISQQIGFGAIRYFDPASAQSVGPFEILMRWTVLVIILTSGALFPIFKGIVATFESLKISQFQTLDNLPLFFLSFFKDLFLSGLLLSSPIVFTNLFVMVILGVVARIVPQMNVLMVSFVVNIGAGLLVFSAISFEFFNTSFELYTKHLAQWFGYFK